MTKFLDSTGLSYFWEKIKAWIPFLSRKTQSIPFGQVDSTSTSTVFTANVDGIDELRDGVCCYIRNDAVGSAANFTLNVNGLGAKPVYSNMEDAERLTTGFQANRTYFFIYNSSRVSNGCWDVYYGNYYNDDYRAYQVRTNSSTLPAKFKTYRYRLLFTSADGNYYVGANASTSTNATAARTPTTEKIDPFGRIVYYGTTDAVNADANFSTAYLSQQITFTLGYSFNNTGAALVLDYPKPVYIKCAPQTDGSAIIDATTPYVQSLPSTEDGKIYIFLGLAYSATAVELTLEHPVYYYKDGAIRIWANEAAQDDTNFVHKTGAETIAGLKRFTNAVTTVDAPFSLETNDQAKHSVDFTLDNFFDDGGDGIAVLSFDDPSGNGDVILRSVSFPINDNDAANKVYVDSTAQDAVDGIEGNFTIVSAKIGAYSLCPKSLVAFAAVSYISSNAAQSELMSFTQTGGTSAKSPITNVWFPIGCKIYYNPLDESGPPAQSTVPQWKLYLTHKSVDARYSAVTGSNVSLGYGLNNTVYLRVMVQNEYWAPYYKTGETNEIIVSANQLVANNFYIYLGKTVGSAVANVQTFELEDNTPLYYYDGTDLIDYATYIAEIGSSSVLPSGGTTGQVLAKASNADNDVEWVNQSAGVTDYDDLDDQPQINGVTLSGNKTSSQLGLQSELTFDNIPTANSTNPVKSGGVKTSLDAKQDTLVSGTNIKTVNNTSLLGSGNIQINDGVGFQTITTQQDGTMQITLTNGDTITVDLNHVHPQYYSKVMESVMPQGGFLPDVVYSLGVLSGNITFALAPNVVGNVNHYYWTFSTATTAITVTWPTRLIWVNGNVPTIAANKHYEISILDNFAVYMETSI